ncbi:hypothetical protein HXX76_007038 [Chlamydomonas incerta]|uniref:PHD finger protein ING n=1 Tax=Chlamydomonas incerta TaxID=51695 RepID=A0A835T4E7_CHLIN|nr:hypothetical protein HXX76_007038 [Chlamydomonas incerta]|eukprot:KAG2435843.1 hypothetical protein HXX76_007038 [Chlamydomonas incerta]
MTDYLKDFIDRAADVPLQLRRRLALIRDLDEKAQALHREIDEHCKRTLAEKSQQHAAKKQKQAAGDDAGAAGGAGGAAAAPYDVESALKRLIGLGDEKVNIANQIYDFMDNHINQLDTDLQQLDGEIEADRKEQGLDGDETACEKLGIEAPAGSRPHTAGKGAADQKKKRGRKKDETTTAAAGGLPPIENEPAYCICNKPSAGQMVGCDNPECTIEWFHFECVGLTEEPKGKWYCPVCRGDLQVKSGKKSGRR